MMGIQDPYMDPSGNVLRNKLGITDQKKLELAENDLATSRTIELLDSNPFPVNGSLQELQSIHRYIFQDVYDWAGQIRTVDINKSGGQSFQPLKYFNDGAQYAEHELMNDNLLQGMNHDEFVNHLAKNYDNFNFLHPFREGNGRTQRVFWSLIADQAGWSIDWRQATPKEINDTSQIARERGNQVPLKQMLSKITVPKMDLVQARGDDFSLESLQVEHQPDYVIADSFLDGGVQEPQPGIEFGM